MAPAPRVGADRAASRQPSLRRGEGKPAFRNGRRTIAVSVATVLLRICHKARQTTGNRGFSAGEKSRVQLALPPNKRRYLGRDYMSRPFGCCPPASPRLPRRPRSSRRTTRQPDRAAAPTECRRPTPAGEATRSDIVVTAQGRRQVLQDVPLAVTAVGGEAMQNSRRDRHPPAEPARPVAARLLDRHRSQRLGPYPRHRHGRRQSRPRKLGRRVHRRRLPLALAASASTSSARSSGSRCCAARRAPCSAATPRPASSTSSRQTPEFEFGGYAEARPTAITTRSAPPAAITGPIGEQVAFRLDGVYVEPRRLLRRRQPDRRHREPTSTTATACSSAANCCSSRTTRSRSG